MLTGELLPIEAGPGARTMFMKIMTVLFTGGWPGHDRPCDSDPDANGRHHGTLPAGFLYRCSGLRLFQHGAGDRGARLRIGPGWGENPAIQVTQDRVDRCPDGNR